MPAKTTISYAVYCSVFHITGFSLIKSNRFAFTIFRESLDQKYFVMTKNGILLNTACCLRTQWNSDTSSVETTLRCQILFWTKAWIPFQFFGITFLFGSQVHNHNLCLSQSPCTSKQVISGLPKYYRISNTLPYLLFPDSILCECAIINFLHWKS